jgi:outer membrane receptor protein involved in Fe transport
MQRTPQLGQLALALATLFIIHPVRAQASATEVATPISTPIATEVAFEVASDASQNAAAQGDMQRVEVSATQLKNARIGLSPKVGTTVYTIDTHMIAQLPQGENTPFNEVLLRLPGVTQDAKGSGAIHVRNDHANVQYRINGVQLPEGISGFGQAIDTRLVDQIDFMTGALPAQFGLRTAGIVDIQTKEGGTAPGGRIGVELGSNSHVQTSGEVFGSSGAFNYYLSGSTLSNTMGIENPQPGNSARHDRTRQDKSFGALSYFVDDNTRLGLMFGTYNGRFQIPNNPNQAPTFSLAGVSAVNRDTSTSTLPSSQLDANQREQNRFIVLSLQKSLGDLHYQVSGFRQESQLHYTPDPVGDLVYNGVASDIRRSSSSNGMQFDASYLLHENHTVRAGLAYTRQLTSSNNTVALFPADSGGVQTSSTPFTLIDNASKTGTLASFYLQDEWHIAAPLTLNYGVRHDRVSAYTDEQQWSPRLNLAYKLSAATALHAGYARYFTPPPQELAAQASIDLYANTTNAPQIATSSNVKAERTRYYDVGISHQVDAHLTVNAGAYYKNIDNLLDEGQFGKALILTPFNYAQGVAKGLELSAVYTEKTWGGYLNLTAQKAQGKHIDSGQALFNAAELAYIASNYIHVDHDQTYTASGGVHYRFGAGTGAGVTNLNADFLYGSGLRRTPDDGAPNSGTLAHYTTVNTNLTHGWKTNGGNKIEGRIAIINLFDQSYLLRDGSGVGVGAPQYGPRRTLYAGLSTSF